MTALVMISHQLLLLAIGMGPTPQPCPAGVVARAIGDDSGFDDLWRDFVDFAGRLYDLGHYDESEKNFDRALKIAEAHFQPEDPRRALGLRNLAFIKAVKGDFAGAEPLAKQAIELCQQAKKPDDRALASHLELLGVIYAGLKRLDEADALLVRSLALHDKAIEVDARPLASVLVNLADVRLRRGKAEAAEPLARRGVSLIEKSTNMAEKIHLPHCLDVLGVVLHSRGKDEEAAEQSERAVTLLEQQRGINHPDLVGLLANRANLNRDLGRMAEAEADYRRALTIGRQELSAPHPTLYEGHPSLNRARMGYAAFLRKSGRVADAEALEKEQAQPKSKGDK